MAGNITHGDIAQLNEAIARARKARGDIAGANRARHSAYVARVSGAIAMAPRSQSDKDKARHVAWQARVSNMTPPKLWESK